MIVFAREPIFTGDGNVFAYQLSFNQNETGVYDASLHKHLQNEEDRLGVAWNYLLEGFTSVLKLSNDYLDEELPEGFSPNDTLIELDEIDKENEDIKTAITNLRVQGYRIVASDRNKITPFVVKQCDFLKVNTNNISPMEVKELRKQTLNPELKLIITNVQTNELYKKCKDIGFDYYQGFFFLNRKLEHNSELPANKLAMLDLLAQINKPTIDKKRLLRVFEHDATLTYLLMRFINNPMVNKYQEISSIKHALNYLGEAMLRKFVAIVSIAQLNQENTSELLQVALVRAKFSEAIADKLEGEDIALSAFLTGLFSLIDVILDRDMNALMEKVMVSNEIKEALVLKKGNLHSYVKLCGGIESAHWETVIGTSSELGITKKEAQSVYLNAVKWANSFSIPKSKDYPIKKT